MKAVIIATSDNSDIRFSKFKLALFSSFIKLSLNTANTQIQRQKGLDF